MDKQNLTPEQRIELAALLAQARIVRGMQVAILALGVGLAVFDGRGWIAVLLGVAAAAWLQTRLPERPAWAEAMRKSQQESCQE